MLIVLLMIRNRDLSGDDCSTNDNEQRSGWC